MTEEKVDGTPLERLAGWMAEQELSNPGLAEHLGLHRSYVYMIAQGQRPITNTFRWRFAEVFGHELAQTMFANGATEEETPEAVAA